MGDATSSSGSSSSSSTTVHISDVSGRTLATIPARRGDTIGDLRKSLLQHMRLEGFPAGVPVQLCCQGAVLRDDRLCAKPHSGSSLRALPTPTRVLPLILIPRALSFGCSHIPCVRRAVSSSDHRELTAWWPRFSAADAARVDAHGGAGGVASSVLASRASLQARALARRAEAATRWLIGAAAPELARIAAARPLLLAKIATWMTLFYAAHWRLELGGPFLVASACWGVWQVGFSERRAGEESAYTVFNDGRALPGQMRGEDLQAQMVGM